MRVLEPGLFTTVQDLGRTGYLKDGITPGGAIDPVALRLGNTLVCNDEGEAGLELTMGGPEIAFQQDALIAVCGGDLAPTVADVAVPTWCANFVQAGSVLRFGPVRWGCRAYLTVAGGIAVPEVMGSRSTFLRARIGGLEGRTLRAGDDIPVGAPSPEARTVMLDAASTLGPLPFALSERKVARAEVLDLYEHDRPVRVMRGPHFDLFDERDQKALVTETFQVSPRSDRMGFRLGGAVLNSSERSELISSAVLTGTVQVPPGGEPIVLMVDRQTTGGYPVIAQVARADLPVLAQLKPGDEIRFEEVTIDQAQTALRAQEERVTTLEKEVRAHAQG